MKDDQEAFALLLDQSQTLREAIGEIESTIRTWLPRTEAEANPKRIIEFLQDRYSVQRELIYELGTVDRALEELKGRAMDHDMRRSTFEEGARRASQDSPLAWLAFVEPTGPVLPEDHLDWFNDDLARNPPRPEAVDKPERAEREAKAEPSQDDFLGWLPGHGRYP